MYVYVYTNIYISMCVYAYTCVHINVFILDREPFRIRAAHLPVVTTQRLRARKLTYAYVYTHIHIYTYTHACIHMSIYVYKCMYMYIGVFTYIYVCVYVCIYVYICLYDRQLSVNQQSNQSTCGDNARSRGKKNAAFVGAPSAYPLPKPLPKYVT